MLYEQSVNFILMLPLSLLYCGLGVSINGIILREKWMIYSPVVAFVLVIYMLMSLIIMVLSGLVVFVFLAFICGNDDYSRAYS